jgi:hypothetical protein
VQNGNTPLFLAARENRVEVIKYLLEVGAPINQPSGNTKFTPLIAAANEGHTEAVLLLLTHPDCDVNACKSNGYTALMSASSFRYLKIVRMLLAKGADVNKSSVTGCSPLYLACSAGDCNIVQELLEAKADVNKPSNVSIEMSTEFF